MKKEVILTGIYNLETKQKKMLQVQTSVKLMSWKVLYEL